MSVADRTFEAPHLIEAMDEALNYNAYLVRELVAWSVSFKQVLDFGAGNGRFAAALQRAGKVVDAVEPDPSLRRQIERQGVHTHAALAEVADASVDAVYSINVLEHIENDRVALREMRRVLRPGGGLLLYVPAFDLLYSSNDRRVGHMRRYRVGPLATLVGKAGFVTIRGRYADSVGFFAALAFRLWGHPDGELSVAGVRAYDRCLFPVSRVVDRLVSRLFGKNILLTATAATRS